jgi:septum formation protein
MKVILASQSPRRAALMDLIKIDFEVLPSEKEKKIQSGSNVEEQAIEVAYEKALDVYNNTQGDRAIIGADTIVVKDNKVYGKPKDRDDAIRMLKELEGEYHTVYTSLAILIEDHDKTEEYKDIVKTTIKVKDMTDEEIFEYVDNERPYDKAGAYAIQSCFCKYIEKIEGNYMSVIGLPVDKVYEVLKEYEVI